MKLKLTRSEKGNPVITCITSKGLQCFGEDCLHKFLKYHSTSNKEYYELKQVFILIHLFLKEIYGKGKSDEYIRRGYKEILSLKIPKNKKQKTLKELIKKLDNYNI